MASKGKQAQAEDTTIENLMSVWWVLGMLLETVNLGDRRRSERMAQIAAACLSAERCCMPAMTGKRGKAALKGGQRFMSNPLVPVEKLREGLYAATLAQAKQGGVKTLVAVYDPTLLDFSAQDYKQDRAAIGDGNGQGYTLLNSAAMDLRSGRFLGPLHQTLVSADGPDDVHLCDYTLGATKLAGGALGKLVRNPQQQFLAHALMVHQRVDADMEVVDVADREFDDGLTLRVLVGLGRNRHFVIRGDDDRAVLVRPAAWVPADRRHPARSVHKARGDLEDGLEDIYLRDVVDSVPLRYSRTVALDARGRVCPDGSKARHRAELSVGATPICLARSSKRGLRAGIPEVPVWLNLVVIRQTNAPRPGKKPLEWILLTDLPIGTLKEIEHVVDVYACRWRAEEFFRTTKDALKVEESELDDAQATARLLYFVTLKAMFLDRLRQAADLPAGVPPTSDQRKALEAGAARAQEIEMRRRKRGIPVPRLTAKQRATMALGLLALRGGWASRNGDHLGNYVLLRGLPVLLHDVSEGRYAWLFDEESAHHPPVATDCDVVGS